MVLQLASPTNVSDSNFQNNKKDQFRGSIDAAQQQMALNFEEVVSEPAFLSSFTRLQVIQNKRPLVFGGGISDNWISQGPATSTI